jgi:RNA polymerase sigma-70 factor (ECF subfamily)
MGMGATPMVRRRAVDDDGPQRAEVVPLVPQSAGGLDFTSFYRRQLPALVALATAMAGSGPGEEIAQEALLRAHRDWSRVERYEKPGAWVRRVAINLALSQRRRLSTEARALARLAQRPVPDAPAPEVEELWAIVRELPPRQAAAVALHYLDDLGISELAAALGCAEGTAKSHLHRGRLALARRLADQEPQP